MAVEPTQNGRGAGGRFAPGNSYAAGHGVRKRSNELRSAFLAACTPAAMFAIAERLVADAMGGDLDAAKLLLGYAMGKPSTDPLNLPDEEQPGERKWTLGPITPENLEERKRELVARIG